VKSSKCGWIFTDDLSANILPSLLFNSQNWPAFCEVTGEIKVALFQLSVANCLFFFVCHPVHSVSTQQCRSDCHSVTLQALLQWSTVALY